MFRHHITKYSAWTVIRSPVRQSSPSSPPPPFFLCTPAYIPFNAGTPFPRLLITVQGSVTHLPPSHLTSAPLTTKLAKAFYTPVNDEHAYPEIPDAVRPEEVSEVPLRQGQSRDRRARGDSPPTGASAPALSQKDKEDLLPRMFHEVFVLANPEEVPVANAEGGVVPPTGSQQPQVSTLSVEV